MIYVAYGAGIFCGLAILSLLAELAADWIFRQISGKVGR